LFVVWSFGFCHVGGRREAKHGAEQLLKLHIYLN
jgi:hypothetical protein